MILFNFNFKAIVNRHTEKIVLIHVDSLENLDKIWLISIECIESYSMNFVS